MIISRLNRMNPAPGSRNLEKFKEEFRRFGCCRLVPAVAEEEGVRVLQDPHIIKREIVFRHADEITPDDPDAIAKKEFYKKSKAQKKSR
jgi:hypothetical protein